MEQNEILSKEVIHKKIADIKYLASQKKVPKVSLRKEILHLEKQLEGVFELEEMLLKTRKQESARTSALKRQIKDLKKKLAKFHDKDLHKKVAKLTHLLGDKLAKHDVVKRAGMISPYPPQPTAAPVESSHGSTSLPSAKPDSFSVSRIKTMEQRVHALRQELEINKNLKEMPEERVRALENQINFMEQKLQEYKGMSHEPVHQSITPPSFHVAEKVEKNAVPVTAAQPITLQHTAPPMKRVITPGEKPPEVVTETKDVKHIMLFGPGDKMAKKESPKKGKAVPKEVKADEKTLHLAPPLPPKR